MRKLIFANAIAWPLIFASACGGAQKTNSTTTLNPSGTTHSQATLANSPSTTDSDEEVPEQEKHFALEEMRIEVVLDEQGQEQTIVIDARGYLDAGNEALGDGQYQVALDSYGRLLSDFRESALAGPALYNSGLAYEGLEQIDDAVEKYAELAKQNPAGRNGVDAQVRIAALYAEYERWAEALGALDQLLSVTKLQSSDRLEALARRGYVLLESKDFTASETTLLEAIAFAKQEQRQAELQGDYYYGMAHFYLGDIARRQFDEIPIRLPEDQMARDIEAKAVLANLANERFGNTVESGNVYWATAAGFRLADIQNQFWRSLVRAPVPPHLSGQVAEIYVIEVHKQSLSFLLKALDVHGKNVKLATIYKGPTGWSRASEREVVRLTELIGRERAGELAAGQEAAAEPSLGRSTNEYLPGRIEL